MSEITMNEVILERRRIRGEINRIKKQLENATKSLQGREYVWNRQITARARLRKDLNAQLEILEKRYEALEDSDLDE